MGGEEAYESDASNNADFDIATVDGPALTARVAGIVGLCMTSLLWVIVSWRLLYHYSGWCRKPNKEDADIRHPRTDGLTTKRLLHGLLWTTMVVEGVAYADMVGTDSSNKFNYVLLDIIGRGILEFSTFVIGTVHWFNVTSRAQAGEKKLAFTLFPAILVIVTIAMTVASTFEAVALLHGGFETVHEYRTNSDIHRMTLLVESGGWGVHGGIVAICGNMVYRRISSLPTFSQVRSQARRNIITKMIIPMIFCSLSYLLRSGWLAADFASRIVSPETTFESGVGWWVGNCWVPRFVPGIMLLYSIRKRDREPGSVDGVPETLLRSPPHLEGPADPFQSFQQTFRDLEDEDAGLPGKKMLDADD